jgi:hypothetical protein
MFSSFFNRRERVKAASHDVYAIIEKLLLAQIMVEFTRVKDAFSTIITNKLAAGYVFGFHDGCFQIFGLRDERDPDAS